MEAQQPEQPGPNPADAQRPGRAEGERAAAGRPDRGDEGAKQAAEREQAGVRDLQGPPQHRHLHGPDDHGGEGSARVAAHPDGRRPAAAGAQVGEGRDRHFLLSRPGIRRHAAGGRVGNRLG